MKEYISYENQYLKLMENIINNGYRDEGRNGVTRKLSNQVLTCNLWEEFPILTTKKVFYKAALKELLWMFKDHSNDVTKLQEQNVHIWDLWVDENNTIGKSYGYQVNNSGQFDKLLSDLKSNDQSRRMIVNLWNVQELKEMTLEPCVFCTVWDVCDSSKCVGESEYPTPDKYLNLTLYQRSGDCPLGVPFDILEYAMLVHMVAHVSGLKPGKITHVITNAHVYENQLEGVKEQICRDACIHAGKARLELNKDIKDFYEYTVDDIAIIGYESYPSIKYQVSE